jgi:hypothetical protein
VWDLTPSTRRGLGQRLWREFLERKQMSGVYQIVHKRGFVRKARYFAAADVLPGLHLSALVGPAPQAIGTKSQPNGLSARRRRKPTPGR